MKKGGLAQTVGTLLNGSPTLSGVRSVGKMLPNSGEFTFQSPVRRSESPTLQSARMPSLRGEGWGSQFPDDGGKDQSRASPLRHETMVAKESRALLTLIGTLTLAFTGVFARLLAVLPSPRFWVLEAGGCYLLEFSQSLLPSVPSGSFL